MLCNSLSIIQQLGARMRQPAGIDETNVFFLSTEFVDDPPDIKARLLGDLAALRALPGVIDADTVITLPLGGTSYGAGVSLAPDQKFPTVVANMYHVTDHGLAAYGLKLLAGRWFHAEEVMDLRFYENHYPASVVLTRNWHRRCFPRAMRWASRSGFHPRNPAASSAWWRRWPHRVGTMEVDLPAGDTSQQGCDLRRAHQAGHAGGRDARRAGPLYQLVNQRVIQNVLPFSEIRQRTFQLDHAVSIVLGAVCALLLAVTACGIVGLTMYWVMQRRRQIGMRRALGARRIDILAYFHTENLLIAGAGAALGIGLALGVNLWLARSLELTRVSAPYVFAGALIVLALCQFAVLWPALRAASIAPAVATRAL